jgi:succinoglycan biosynthesis protein ExoA
LLAGFWRPFGWAYVSVLGLYALFSLVFSLRQAARHGWRYLPLLPLLFAILHISWGVGFLVGLVALPLSSPAHRQ